MNSNDWVAEHMMGFERGSCHGNWGGGSMGSDGTYETWFYCDWCGRLVDYGKAGPCAQYPFPKFTLVDLMRKLGEKGYHVMVRVDPERERHKFTVVLNGLRICDTGNPLKSLCNHIAVKQLGSITGEPEKKRFVSGEQMEFEPGYGWRKAAPDWGPLCLRRECCFRWRHCNIPYTVKEPSPAFFANIRDAIKLLRKAVGQVGGK